MTDNMTPQLTLDPTAAAAEAVPTLTLTPEAPEAPQVEEEKKIEPVEMDDKLLTDGLPDNPIRFDGIFYRQTGAGASQ